MLSSGALDELSPGGLSAHRHLKAYATIVRSGRYAEAGTEGRLFIERGMLVLHPNLHLHSNVIEEEGAVWNIDIGETRFGRWRALKGRTIEHLAAREHPPRFFEVCEAMESAEEVAFEPPPPWLAELSMLDEVSFADVQHEVSREHAHRTFFKHFGIPPGRYRRERRLQQAIRMMASAATLVDIAAATGFADQSHMTRLFRRELGMTPGQVRTRITPVQDRLVQFS